jgi:N-acetylmuramoyl-L-alanine amidase
MGKRIVLQAGHINSQFSSLSLGSGAPGEQELTLRIANRLSTILRERGFTVVQTDANAYADTVITKQDWDLFLALHGDADYAGDNGSGFATFPEPSTDGATVESQRIAKVINDFYFPEVQIVYRDLANANTKFYYMWKYLTAKTPCVLIEMGQVQDPHDRILLANTDLIANALGRAICNAFNIPFEVVVTPPVPPTPPGLPPTSVPPPYPDLRPLIDQIKGILYGKGFWWVKLNNIKKLLPQ